MRCKKKGVLNGWSEVCGFTGYSRPTLIKYGFPIHRAGRGSRVVAIKREIMEHVRLFEMSVLDQSATLKP